MAKKNVIQIGGKTYDLSKKKDREALENDQDAKVTEGGASVHIPNGDTFNVSRGSVKGTVIQARDIEGDISF